MRQLKYRGWLVRLMAVCLLVSGQARAAHVHAVEQEQPATIDFAPHLIALYPRVEQAHQHLPDELSHHSKAQGQQSCEAFHLNALTLPASQAPMYGDMDLVEACPYRISRPFEKSRLYSPLNARAPPVGV